MTNDQLQYQMNCKTSKSLCLRMERLREDADYFEKALNYNSLEIAVFELELIKQTLDAIWNDQVDLFFKIQSEHSKLKIDVFMESIRVHTPRNYHLVSDKNY